MFKIKIPIASQVKDINNYKYTRRKVLNCNVNIFFEQQCLQRYLLSKYAIVVCDGIIHWLFCWLQYTTGCLKSRKAKGKN